MKAREINELTQARMKALDQEIGYDYILETRTDPEFTEFVTSTGGDVARYRVYGTSAGDFRIYAK